MYIFFFNNMDTSNNFQSGKNITNRVTMINKKLIKKQTVSNYLYIICFFFICTEWSTLLF
jgi:hypothetical protein